MHALVLLLLVGVASAGFAPLHKSVNGPKGAYIIKFKDNVDVDSVTDGIQSHVQVQRLGQAKVSHRYHSVLKGMAAQLSDEALEYIRTLDKVEYVSEDGMAYATNEPWGLDRISQRNLPLDNYYSTAAKYKQGAGVTIYILDTGVRISHDDFNGRAQFSFDAYGGSGADKQGHGTHCAGSAGGSYFGVAKQATIRNIKVLGDNGSGSWSAIISGLDRVVYENKKPCVASMSLGGPMSTILDDAVRRTVGAGFPVVAAAGNDNKDACGTSPAHLQGVVTVGSTDRYDRRSSFSNYGSCVDVFAPGSNIESAYHTSDRATTVMSGTSMACPHVAGLAALYLAENPSLSTWDLLAKLEQTATPGVISNVGWQSPNKLGYVSQ